MRNSFNNFSEFNTESKEFFGRFSTAFSRRNLENIFSLCSLSSAKSRTGGCL